MFRVELIFFSGCPSIPRARQAVKECGILDFQETEMSTLEATDPRRRLSSPSIFVNGELVVGSECGAAACSVIDWDVVASRIRTLVSVR